MIDAPNPSVDPKSEYRQEEARFRRRIDMMMANRPIKHASAPPNAVSTTPSVAIDNAKVETATRIAMTPNRMPLDRVPAVLALPYIDHSRCRMVSVLLLPSSIDPFF